MEKKFNVSIIRKAFPFIILVVLICLCVFVGNFRSDFIKNLRDTDETSKDISELEWNFIKAVIYEDYLSAGIQSKIIAEEITEKIKKAYPDLQVMQYELENPQEFDSPKYLQIIKNEIRNKYLHNVNDDENDIFVCTREGIIMDTSPSTAAFYPNDWKSIYNRNTNPDLMKNAVALLFNKSSDMIYWEHHILQIKDERLPRLPSNVSLEELRQIYLQYGIDGLKHVQFLAPAYITETGDIFGIEDIGIRGIRNDNHKIIVVQTFNPYEQLMARHLGELEKFNTFKTKMIQEHKMILIEHAIVVIITVILIVVLAYFMMVFNNAVFHDNESKTTFSKDDNILRK